MLRLGLEIGGGGFSRLQKHVARERRYKRLYLGRNYQHIGTRSEKIHQWQQAGGTAAIVVRAQKGTTKKGRKGEQVQWKGELTQN